MNWQPVYGCLMLFVSLISYLSGICIENKISKGILTIGLLTSFGVLFIFKYANFISSSVNEILNILNIKMHIPFLNVLLPVGISFYTFQAVGYIIDVYKGNIKAEKNFFIYALFISFFPQLVAGPIERARNLLPQFHKIHSLNTDNITKGLRLILWGYFMKVVVADRLAIYVDSVYNNVPHHNGTSLSIATFFFTFQIYCDFGGYSNIAVGCAKIMGFDLMTNFRRPYLAISVADFWRRWHISLSTWFKDYLYIPLGGNHCNKWRNYYNLLVTFIVSGIWHGANWTFIIWGTLNGIFQIVGKMIDNLMIKRGGSYKKTNLLKASSYIWNLLITFLLISFTWIFFRANNVNEAFLILRKIIFEQGILYIGNIDTIVYCISFICILILCDIFQEIHNGHHILLDNPNSFFRRFSYLVICLFILLFGVFDSSQFIYFQF
jgi:D-alanyl-lipoteichoic acid acyltransferase DltB (MBOAT superfamily)